jgi:hypothetical protein
MHEHLGGIGLSMEDVEAPGGSDEDEVRHGRTVCVSSLNGESRVFVSLPRVEVSAA